MARYYSRVTSVRFEDAVGVGITVGPGPGDFSHGVTNAENTEKMRVLDRGVYDGHIEGDDLEQEWSISVALRNQSLTSATVARVLDFMNRTGIYADSGSTPVQTVNTNPSVWAWKTIVTMTNGTVATFTLPCCVGGYAFAEAKESHTLSISGTNNGAIVRA